MAPQARPAAPPQAQPVQPNPFRGQHAKGPRAQGNQQVYRNRNQLAAYIRANGNMSVARRTAVVGGALVNLGYTPQQAEQIALDAPLNASMYDDQAVQVALAYAESLAPVKRPRGQPAPPSIRGAVQPTAIPMPKRAAQALAAARAQQAPVRSATNIFGSRVGGVLDRLGQRLKPITDRVGNSPSPGGIGGLFAVNLLFLFFAVPANSQGFTRAQLMWLTLMNRTNLDNQVAPATVENSGIVVAMMDIAQSLGLVARGIGVLAGDVQSVVGGVENIGGDVLGTVGNIIGGTIWQIGHPFGGGPEIPQVSQGPNAPPPSQGSIPPPRR